MRWLQPLTLVQPGGLCCFSVVDDTERLEWVEENPPLAVLKHAVLLLCVQTADHWFTANNTKYQ